MAKRQTRKAIHISRRCAERLATYCHANGIRKSALVEYLIANPDAPQGDLEAFVRWNKSRLKAADQQRQSTKLTSRGQQ